MGDESPLVKSYKPLDNFPLMRSSNLEEVSETLARICAKPVFISTGGIDVFDATMNYCPINNASLYYRAYGVGMRLTFPETDFFLQLIPLGGNGELVIGNTATPLMVGTTEIVSPNTVPQLQCSADYEHLVLKVDAQTLTRKLAAMTGAIIGKPLVMEARQDHACPRVSILPRYIRALADTLSGVDPNEPLPAWWRAQTEQLLMTMLLCCNRHNYSHLLDENAPESAPADVRRAEDYVAANWQRPITLEDLAAASGVSALSLFRSFKRHRGYSPMQFVERLRSMRRVPH